MRAWKVETLLGSLIIALLLGGLWQQRQILNQLVILAGRGGAAVPQGAAAAPALAPAKAPPAASVVSLDFALGGAPSKGRSQVEVAMLEFSDFQCPFCSRYVRDTFPRVFADYVDTGKIRYVFRNFPLESIHPNAKNAALAATCSALQGRFWEMHDRLFLNQGALDLPSLLGYGAGLGIDENKYRTCLQGQATGALVQTDKEMALKAELTGTPAFFIGRVGSDGVLHATRKISGAFPYSVFQTAIEDILAGR